MPNQFTPNTLASRWRALRPTHTLTDIHHLYPDSEYSYIVAACRGIAGPKAKTGTKPKDIPPAKVKELRTSGTPGTALAQRYGVTPSRICQIYRSPAT